jgi:hypothetical protein
VFLREIFSRVAMWLQVGEWHECPKVNVRVDRRRPGNADGTNESANSGCDARGTEPVGHCQRTALIRFQSDFLRKHYVARDEITMGNETPANLGGASAIKLMHITRDAVIDTVSTPGVASDDIKILLSIELRALRR